MGFSLMPSEDEYFVLFAQFGGKLEEAAGALVAMMDSKSENYAEHLKIIKGHEHFCDDLTHEITKKLNKSFITPFDREDIYGLSSALDDVCDYIEATAQVIVMYNIRRLDDDARNFARIIQTMTGEIRAALAGLKSSDEDESHFAKIRLLEKEADELHFQAIGRLFKNETDLFDVIRYKELYEVVENAVDRCQSVSNIIAGIILKHH